jgi:hypothetical protein
MTSFVDDMGTFFIRKITNLRAELACVDDCTYSNLGDPCGVFGACNYFK